MSEKNKAFSVFDVKVVYFHDLTHYNLFNHTSFESFGYGDSDMVLMKPEALIIELEDRQKSTELQPLIDELKQIALLPDVFVGF